MPVIKAAIALPSLNKSVTSRTSTPVPSESGSKRNGAMGVLDAIPRARSRSGDGNKRVPSGGSAASTTSATVNGNGSASASASAAAASNGQTLPLAQTSSHHNALRPKLASLLSGKSTPHTPAMLSPTAVAGSGPATAALATPSVSTGGLSSSGVGTPSANGPVAISTLEASYVTKVGMTLNDAVNKVFPSPANFVAAGMSHVTVHAHDSSIVAYKGLCAPRTDRAREVGQLIASEIHAAVNDQYLLRSLLRSAVLKSLSIFLSRLESLMISPSADPAILTVARTLKEAENPPQAQRYTFLVLRSAWELKKGLLKACSNVEGPDGKEEVMPKFVKDTLAPWITKVDLLANKIWQPILFGIKEALTRTVVEQGQAPGSSPSQYTASLAVPAGPTSSTRSLSLSRSSTPVNGMPALPAVAGSNGSSSNAALQSACLHAPYLRDLAHLLAATTRVFAWASVAEAEHQKWKVSVGSAVIWKMLLTSSSKRLDGDNAIRRRPSPPLGGGIIAPLSAVGNGHLTPVSSAVNHLGPTQAAPAPRRSMSAIGMGRLRGSSTPAGKRSPSPTHGSPEAAAAKLVLELEAFEALVERFVSSLGISPPEPNPAASNEGPCPNGKNCAICKGRFIPDEVDDSDDEVALPREAMQEAMMALSSFIVVLRAFTIEGEDHPRMLLRAVQAVDDITLAPDICPNLIRALDLLPPLILLQTLVSRIPRYWGVRMPYELWSTTWSDYEKTMKGFHTGEEWVGEVGWELLKEIRRVYRRLAAEADSSDDAANASTITLDDASLDEEGWLELLRSAIVILAEVDDLDEDASQSNITATSLSR